MFKNLSANGLGVAGRQNEMIELGLTYGFQGINIGIKEMAKRAETFGEEFAKRFLISAPVTVGSFRLPIRITGSDDEFKAALETLKPLLDLAASVEAQRTVFNIEPASATLPYHENFEQQRARIGELADLLAVHQISLGIGIDAIPSSRANREFQFIHEPEPLLMLLKTAGHSNVGLYLDYWNWTLGGGGLDPIRELDGSQIVAVDLADLPDDIDRATISDQHRLLPSGEADSPSAQLCAVLKEIGYEGGVSLSVSANQFGGASRDAVVQKISARLDEILAAASEDSESPTPVVSET